MKLESLLRRSPVVPFAEGSRIPWNDPAFSARMLREHLSQQHDRASRRLEIVDRQVAWMHHAVLGGEAGRVLDLGCGPGLYTSRLAELGHQCAGIDFSPAAIEHAKKEASDRDLACEYRLGDLRHTELGTGYDAVIWWFGDFHTFSPTEAASLLARVHSALAPKARVALELHEQGYVQDLGELPPSWRSQEAGLFADQPHLTLRECQWHPDTSVATERYFVFREDGEPDVYAQTTQSYTEAELETLFQQAGLVETARYGSLVEDPNDEEAEPDEARLFGLVLEPHS